MGDLSGRNILITGANSGIGKATALALAQRGARLWLACRSEEATRAAMTEIESATGHRDLHFLALDLGDLDSVRECAAAFLKLDEPLHVLLNNAGIAGHRGQTRQGFEIHFGVNHLGHFLLTELLLERIRASAPARIVNVSSRSHVDAKGVDFEAVRKTTESLSGLPEYGVSKLCNILHARELATRLDGSGVTTYALHPGVIASNAWRRIPWPIDVMAKWFMKSNQEGAQPSLRCATAPELATESGAYYDEGTKREPTRVARSAALASRLREYSDEWTRS